MTLDESIAAREKKIEVSLTKLPDALMRVRLEGGFVLSFDVNYSTYTLHIYWRPNGQPQQQQELI